jgi:hypothetical protein
MTAGSASFAAVPVCREWGPRVLFQSIPVNGPYSSYLMKLLGSVICLV